jgi:type IV pilus biogenesis protein CpaD/CtpE
MAVVNIKSTAVQNADAAVQTQSPTHLAGAKEYTIIGTAAIAAGDDDGSVMRIARVHSSWRLTSIKIFNDAIAAGSWACTLYQTAANGGAAVGAALYNTTIDAATAHTAAPLEVVFGTNRAITKIGQQVWEDAGLTADPGRWYDLGLTCTTAGTAAGNVGWKIDYISGSS